MDPRFRHHARIRCAAVALPLLAVSPTRDALLVAGLPEDSIAQLARPLDIPAATPRTA